SRKACSHAALQAFLIFVLPCEMTKILIFNGFYLTCGIELFSLIAPIFSPARSASALEILEL
ncbi:MAG: hypothetical protein RR954_09915, partial [Christensenellaceae bacterium]